MLFSAIVNIWINCFILYMIWWWGYVNAITNLYIFFSFDIENGRKDAWTCEKSEIMTFKVGRGRCMYLSTTTTPVGLCFTLFLTAFCYSKFKNNSIAFLISILWTRACEMSKCGYCHFFSVNSSSHYHSEMRWSVSVSIYLYICIFRSFYLSPNQLTL